MSLSIPPDMIRFDSSYSRDIFSDTKPVSISDLSPEEVSPMEVLPSKLASLSMYETGNVMRAAIFKLRTKAKAEAAREMDFHHVVPVVKTWRVRSATASLSSQIGTNLIVRPIDLESVVLWEEGAKIKATQEIRHSYASRTEFLREEAAEEGILFNENSRRDFWRFIEMIPFPRRGRLFLMDNGDLRAVWDDNEDNLVGIQFLGNSSVRYVIFKRRTASGFVSRVAGSDTLNGLIAQIKAFELDALLCA